MRDAHLSAWRERADAALEHALALPQASTVDRPRDPIPPRLHAAMRHAVLLGGKRLRPLLVYASGSIFDAEAHALDAPAVAIELMHAYSLVHDDLPSMDDDALRRGQPTVHVAFDEATAILAGDALQSLAYAILADAPVTDGVRVELLRTLAQASGAAGMCGGQALDLAATGTATLEIDALERLHAMKTGALIRAAVRMGAVCSGATADQLDHLDRFASALGLAFQVRDDVLDVESDSATLGKTAGKDASQAKATFPALIGLDASRARLQQLDQVMRDALVPLGPQALHLSALGDFAIRRSN